MNNDKLPWDISNVTFQEDGEWYMAIVGNEKLYVKIPVADIENFIKGGMARAFHIMTASVAKPLYLSALTATEEPWLLVGSQCSVLAKVHDVQGKVLDDEIKRCIAGEEKGPKLLVPDKKIIRAE